MLSGWRIAKRYTPGHATKTSPPQDRSYSAAPQRPKSPALISSPKFPHLRHDPANLRADLGSDRLIDGFRRLRRLREQRIDFSDLLLGEIAILDRLGVDEHV